MESRTVVRYQPTVAALTNVATGITENNYYSPFAGYESFSVLQDNKYGDHVTVNSHEFRKIISGDYTGHYGREDAVDRMRIDGWISGWASPEYPDPIWSEMYNSAIADMYEQIRSGGVGSGLDLSIDIAQARQVADMTRDVTRLRSYARGLRNLPARWLEFQYGWRPLVNSIYDTFDALMNRRLIQVARVVGKSRSRSQKVFDQSGPWPGSRQFISVDTTYRVKVECTFEIENTTRQILSGYTSLNPASIAWELCPYSFVVDWVYDVGGYLKNLESAALFGNGFKGGYMVEGYISRQAGHIQGGEQNALPEVSHYGEADAFYRESYKRRTPIYLYPIPYPPRFNLRMGIERYMSAASLLAVAFQRQ